MAADVAFDVVVSFVVPLVKRNGNQREGKRKLENL